MSTSYDERREQRLEYRREVVEKAHDEMRSRGYTDDVPIDTCGVTALFWLLGLVTLLASLAGKVTI